MKRLLLILCICILLSGCCAPAAQVDIAATTLPVWQFTSILCQGTGLRVTRLVSESVSCLHDYTLTVAQSRSLEAARLVVVSGAGLEDFMENVLQDKNTVEAAISIPLLDSCGDHDHADHAHSHDPHIWLSPAAAMQMAKNICAGLAESYPEHALIFEENLQSLLSELQKLLDYGRRQLTDLSSRELITFHEGFAYFAQCFDLTILAAIEEESGSEVSAQELIGLIHLVKSHQVPAVFTEENGSDASARIISRETQIPVYTLSMAMAGDDYFSAMYRNIDTIREALG